MSDFSTMSLDELWDEAASANKNYRAEILYELGCRHAAQTNYARAEELFIQSHELAKAVGEELLAGRANYSLGLVHYHRNEYLWAVPCFQEAANSYQLCGRFGWQGDAIYYMTLCLIEEEDYEGAFLNYDFAIGLYESEDQFEDSAKAYIGKGNLHGFRGEQQSALECFQRAQELYSHLEDAAGVVRALDRVGAALLDLGRVDEAVENFRQAKNTVDYVEPGIAAVRAAHRLGEGLKCQGKWLDAEEILAEAAREFKALDEPVSAALSDLYRAQCLVELKRYDEAQTLFTQLESFYQSVKNVRLRGILEISRGTLAKLQEDHDREYSHYEKALAIGLKNSDEWIEIVAHICLAETQVGKNEFDQALTHIESINLGSVGQQMSFLNRIKNVKAACLIGQGNFSEAEPILLDVLGSGSGENLVAERSQASLLLALIRESEGRDEDAGRLRASAQKLNLDVYSVGS